MSSSQSLLSPIWALFCAWLLLGAWLWPLLCATALVLSTVVFQSLAGAGSLCLSCSSSSELLCRESGDPPHAMQARRKAQPSVYA